jgi:hypothetical protein
MRALERIPSRRFQTGDAMADALEACIHDLKSSHAQVAAELRDRFPELEPSASGLRTRGSFPSSEAIEDAHASYTEAVSNSGTQRFRPTLPVVHTIEDMGSWSDGGLDASTSPRASQPAIRAELSSHESAADAPQTRTRSAAIPLALACSFVLLVAALVAFYQHQRVTKPRAVAVSPSAPLTSPKKPAHDPALASRSESKSAVAPAPTPAPASAPTTTKRAPARSRSVAKSRPAPHAAPSRTDVENGELLSPF